MPGSTSATCSSRSTAGRATSPGARQNHDRWRELPDASDEVIANVHPFPGEPCAYPEHIVGLAGYHMGDTACPIGAGTWEAAVWSAHQRVAILDLDVHHGNGTQGIFYRRADVLTVPLHADAYNTTPFFVGHAHETGAGDGLGYNINRPLPVGTGDAGYLAALRRVCLEIQAFAPGALVVAPGLDGHEKGPYKGLAVTTDGFAAILAQVAALGLPTVLVQEGGYLSDDLGPNLASALRGFESAA